MIVAASSWAHISNILDQRCIGGGGDHLVVFDIDDTVLHSDSLTPISGAADAITRITKQENCTIIYLTSRSSVCSAATDLHSIAHESVILCSPPDQFTGCSTKGPTLLAFYKRLLPAPEMKITFIDDMLENVECVEKTFLTFAPCVDVMNVYFRPPMLLSMEWEWIVETTSFTTLDDMYLL